MAVVSISRIQVRRGRKNEGTGLPQLASGELGWAIDSQELYIGNGSVAEGAPYVGNTKLLTEHDNIFELVKTYTYQAPLEIAGTVQRTLQERLDDNISVRAFGITGDGSDMTSKLQVAIDSLWVNPSVSLEESRITLYFEPGLYLLSETITLPPHVTLKGAGKDKTVIRQTAMVNAFSTEYDPSDTYSTQSRYVSITDMTIKLDDYSSAIALNNCRNSEFARLRIEGPFTSTGGDSLKAIGFFATSLSQAVQTQYNTFRDIEFANVTYGFYSDNNFVCNLIVDCIYDEVYGGIALMTGLASVPGLPSELNRGSGNVINHNSFLLCDNVAINIPYGERNSSANNKFMNVGNDGGSANTQTVSAIVFGELGNTSLNDYFDRAKDVGAGQVTDLGLDEYVPNIAGIVHYNESFYNEVAVENLVAEIPKIKLSAPVSGKAIVSYNYTSTSYNFTRIGELELTFNKTSGIIIQADNYTTAGVSTLDDNLVFRGQLGTNTVIVYAKNPGDTGSLTYTVTYLYA